MEKGSRLHLVVFPWLAMGHLIPYFRFSIVLAQKGHRVSFISTPKNLKRLPKIPKHLSSSISLISIPLPSIPGLPSDAEITIDIPYNKQQLLKKAFDLLQLPLTDFLHSEKPDWVIYDYASHWLPSLASKLGISTAFFSLFTAAVLSFVGPPPVIMKDGDPRSTAEDFTVVPWWVPFDSNIKYRVHEVVKYVEKTVEDENGPSDTVRFGFSAGAADVVIMRSSPEFEPEWFDLYGKLSEKPVVPIGFMPPIMEEEEEEEDNCDEKWGDIKEWLNKQETKSVLYVALGTEAALTREEITKLALGLEKSSTFFIWVLRNPPGSTQNVLEMLPAGFEERVKDVGMVYSGWVPQVKILSHESVWGILTHCGWNSVVEGLSLNKSLILFPVLNDQGLNARLLQEKNLGFEIPRNEVDGAFTPEIVAEMVRKVKVNDSVNELRDVFANKVKNNQYLERSIRYLEENKFSLSNSIKKEITSQSG